jgi:hypothetical protein
MARLVVASGFLLDPAPSMFPWLYICGGVASVRATDSICWRRRGVSPMKDIPIRVSDVAFSANLLGRGRKAVIIMVVTGSSRSGASGFEVHKDVDHRSILMKNMRLGGVRSMIAGCSRNDRLWLCQDLCQESGDGSGSFCHRVG